MRDQPQRPQWLAAPTAPTTPTRVRCVAHCSAHCSAHSQPLPRLPLSHPATRHWGHWTGGKGASSDSTPSTNVNNPKPRPPIRFHHPQPKARSCQSPHTTHVLALNLAPGNFIVFLHQHSYLLILCSAVIPRLFTFCSSIASHLYPFLLSDSFVHFVLEPGVCLLSRFPPEPNFLLGEWNSCAFLLPANLRIGLSMSLLILVALFSHRIPWPP